ncbi:prenyltransferase/squalene oxidase repeat-containing protein [Novipirellula maiorica]|uniref:prenyltransferase/squalene oxidase repeat-containing protein n=1 Tax=Novipirellula maiorica TaxID=1265734 RepID=UPI001F33AECA|nr:prenyltransferase/squalene oxidase repeat-containing protein [Rhodopirellula maiorica]
MAAPPASNSPALNPPPSPPTAAVPPASQSPASPPIPPPPPPRATLPPLRSASTQNENPLAPHAAPQPATVVASGIGSAKSLRWRDELPKFIKRKVRPDQPTAENGQADAEAGEPSTEEKIVKGAPPWLISTVIHLVLLLALALISTPAGDAISRVLLEIGQSETKEEVNFTEFVVDPSDVLVDASDIETDQEVMVDIPSIFEDANDSIDAEVAMADIGLGPEIEIARPMFNGRSGAMKSTLLALYGGTKETQHAVEMGLEWLSRNQSSDGGWSKRGPYADGGVVENRTAATAMALLAFLGDGNTHTKGKYAENVDKGVKYLVKQQSRSGFMAKDARGHEQAYAQAQATIVLCELYGMTKDSWLRDKAQVAIEYAQDAQGTQGGWRYYPKSDSDTSITGWFVMALESGLSAGLDVNRSVLYNVEGYLDLAQASGGAQYGYQPRSRPSPPMTAEGLLCRQYLGWPRNHAPMVQGIDALWEVAPFDYSDRDSYYWYYATQLLHHYGGEPWQRWNEKMRVQLPAHQQTRGRERGSWDPQGDRWGDHGRLYSTCLSLFCLEVYYRHMPLYAGHAVE